MAQLGNGNCNTVATPPTLVLQNSSPKVNSNAWEQRINLILLTYNLASLSGPNSARARAHFDVKSHEAIQI